VINMGENRLGKVVENLLLPQPGAAGFASYIDPSIRRASRIIVQQEGNATVEKLLGLPLLLTVQKLQTDLQCGQSDFRYGFGRVTTGLGTCAVAAVARRPEYGGVLAGFPKNLFWIWKIKITHPRVCTCTPMRYTPMRCTPMKHTPVRYTPMRCTPMRYTPMRYTPVRCMPVRYIPMRYTPMRCTL
jgi:hypothetical protein